VSYREPEAEDLNRGVAGLLTGRGGGAAAFDPLPASTSWAEQGLWADRQLALLRSQYEGRWEIWSVPSSGACLMTVTQMQAIDAELGARRRTAGSQEAS
jgi:hypothetical protein